MFFRISEQAHTQSVLDFVNKQQRIDKLALHMQIESLEFWVPRLLGVNFR